MHLIALGLNHNSASINLRELVAVSEPDLPSAISDLAKIAHVREAAILSTCNRTEFYVVTASLLAGDTDRLATFFCTLHGITHDEIREHLYCYRDDEAVAHIMKVASGLDSMMLGEYQIMAQVKAAYAAAQAAHTTDITLNSLFQTALNTGKRVRAETQISRGTFSIGAAAVEFAMRIFGESLQACKVLLIGAGQTSELTARHLQAHGVVTTYVANRTLDRAEKLAAQLEGAIAVDYERVQDYLVKADIVIASTSSESPIILREDVRKAMRERRNRALYLVDIAVPRDIEPSIGELDNVFLYNIDDLRQIVQHAQQERILEITHAERIVAESAKEYMSSRQTLDATPLIISVRERLESLRLDEMARLRAKLPHLDERELRAIEQSLQSFSNKIAHGAIVSIKESFQRHGDHGYARLAAIKAAFGLDDKDDK